MSASNNSSLPHSTFWSVVNVLGNAKKQALFPAIVIGLPSVLLYAYEVVIILCNPKLSCLSFYRLVLARAISNLFNYVLFYFFSRFGTLALFLGFFQTWPKFLYNFLYFYFSYGFHVENISTAALLSNRLSAILRPFDYERIWRTALPVSLALIFVLPLPFTVGIFSLDMFVHTYPDGTYNLDYTKVPNEINDSQVMCWGANIFLVVSLALNLATYVAYKCRTKLLGGQQMSASNAKMERKMTLFTVWTFVAGVGIAVLMAFIYFTSENGIDAQGNPYSPIMAWFGLNETENWAVFLVIFNCIPLVNDFCTYTIPACMLLWMSSEIRECAVADWNRMLGKIAIEHQVTPTSAYPVVRQSVQALAIQRSVVPVRVRPADRQIG